MTRPPTDDPLLHDQRRARRPLGAQARLTRGEGGRIAGICAGIATFTGARVGVVRGLWLASLLPSLGLTAIAYPVLWLLLPAPITAAKPGRSYR